MKCLERIVRRQGRCYELTTKIMIEEPGSEHWLLTHGRIHYGPGDREPSLAHAWIDLSGGEIYDIHVGYMPFKAYRAGIGGVVVDHIFSKAEVLSYVRWNHLPWRPAMLRTSAASFAFRPAEMKAPPAG